MDEEQQVQFLEKIAAEENSPKTASIGLQRTRRPAVYLVWRIVRCAAQYQDESPVGRRAWEETAGTTGLIQLFYYYYLSSVAAAVVHGGGVEKVIRPYL